MRRLTYLLPFVLCVACGPDEENNGSTNGATNGATNGTTNGSTNGTTNGSTNGTTNGSTNGTTNNNALTCSDNDPGSDIMWVRLEDAAGSVLAYGFVASDDIVADGNGCTSLDHLDGSEPAGLDASECADPFSDDTVTALGQGGSIVVGFADDNGTIIDLTSDLTVVVGEYGAQCPTGTVADTYEVYLCTEAEGPDTGDTSSCTDLVGSGDGQTGLTLDFATGFEVWLQIVDTTA